MTDSMVERVARVFAMHHFKTSNNTVLSPTGVPPSWEDYVDHNWVWFQFPARAAVEAMKEATQAMSLAGWAALEGNPVSPPLQCWEAMIDAALAEPVPK